MPLAGFNAFTPSLIAPLTSIDERSDILSTGSLCSMSTQPVWIISIAFVAQILTVDSQRDKLLRLI